jgi:hypothetical protein
MAPQRSKNLTANESISADQAALRGNILNDSASDAAELNRLKLLQVKQQLNIISEEEIRQLIGPPDPVDRLSRKILIRLNGMSSLSPQLIHIMNVMNSKSRVEISKRLAQKYVNSQALKHTLRTFLGPDLNAVGEEEVYEDLGREDAIGSNPMTSSQRSAFRAGQRSGTERGIAANI